MMFLLLIILVSCFGRGSQTFVVCLRKYRNCLTYKIIEEKMEVVRNGQYHDNKQETYFSLNGLFLTRF